MVSLRTTGDVNASNFARSPDGDTFHGALGELIVYSQPLSDLEIKQVERYLSQKWATGLTYAGQEFSIDNNGKVRALGKVDYDLGPSRSLKVRATNENNASVVGEFVISVVDAADDLDGGRHGRWFRYRCRRGWSIQCGGNGHGVRPI